MSTMEITTMIGCPLQCTFCPQDKLKAAYDQPAQRQKSTKYMSFEDFKIILSKIPKHVRIDFSGMSEPWANPKCSDMLRHSLEEGFDVAIYTTLHGMDETEAEALVALLRKHHAQIQVICLHLPDAFGNMRGWRPSDAWEGCFRQFCGLRDEGVISRFELMTMHPDGRLDSSLDHLGIRLPHWSGDTVAGNVDESQIAGQPFARAPRHGSVVTCSLSPFYDHNVVLPNGDVALCCYDYGLKHIIGNLLSQTYYELFASEGLNELRRWNMTPGFSKCSLCKSCPSAVTYKHGDDARWQAA